MLGSHRFARSTTTLLTVAVVLLLGLGPVGCSNSAEDGPATPEPTTTPQPDPEPSDSAEQTSLNVYLVRGEHLGVGLREVPQTVAVAEKALQELLGGPTAEDGEAGLATEIPAGTELLGVDIDDGVATVDLSSEFASGGGSLSMQMRIAQIVFTLTQFESVDRVAFKLDGAPTEAIGGEGVLVSPPVDRMTFADNTAPAILVESPAPWQEVTSPLRVTGMSNTFEATMSYEITDGEGLIVTEGFATATSGTGTWGTFDFTVDYKIERGGVGALIVFERSAKDGSRINLVEIPLRMSE